MPDIFTAAARLDARRHGSSSGDAAWNAGGCEHRFSDRRSPGAAIGQLVVLEMTPDVLGGVELGGIGRELLDLDRSLEGFEILAHQCRAMRGQAVPDHEQGFADLTAERVQELDDLRTLDCTRKESEVEASKSDPGDDRELMPVEVILQDRGLAARRPGAHPGRPLAQSRLIYEDDDSALFCGVFFLE